MSKKQKNKKIPQGLGRGLSSLLGEINQTSSSIQNSIQSDKSPVNISMSKPDSIDGGFQLMDIGLISRGRQQPRKVFVDSEMEELSSSIKEHGVLQPIILRKTDSGRYEIIAGERRFKASKMAGLTKIPAIIKDITDREALAFAIIENVQREDLSPIEEAFGYKRLIDELSYTQDSVSKSIGKSRSHITNLLRLLLLPDEVQNMVNDGLISMGHARTLINNEHALEIAKEIAKRALNVRDAERLAAEYRQKKPKTIKELSVGDQETFALKKEYITEAENSIKLKYGWNTIIKYYGNADRGQLIVKYNSIEDLDRILKQLV
jgi:ParB family chromosome partitioning protein